jgi:zinc transporter, ZIP family
LSNIVTQSLLYSLAPAAGMVVGGCLAAWWRPGGQFRSYIQHFAAGIVFAAVGVEILPDVMHRDSPLAATVGFALGVGAMLAIRELSRRAEAAGERSTGGRSAWALVAAVAVDVLVDGMLIGVGFAVGERQGLLVALSLTGCTFSLGLATTATLLASGSSCRHAVWLTTALAAVPVVGAVCGALLASRLTGVWMEGVLSFTCAALLYLVTEELLVEAHEAQEGPETPLTTAIFFIGFLALLIAAMMMEK